MKEVIALELYLPHFVNHGFSSELEQFTMFYIKYF